MQSTAKLCVAQLTRPSVQDGLNPPPGLQAPRALPVTVSTVAAREARDPQDKWSNTSVEERRFIVGT